MGGAEIMSDPSPQKIKSNKMSLCKLLTQRKTKVGCFKTNSEESSIDLTENKSPVASPNRSHLRLRSSLNRNYSDPETKTTRLSLCCAMTESSHTPPHSQHGGHIGSPQSHNHSLHVDEDEESVVIQTKDCESQTTNSNTGSPAKLEKSEIALVEMYDKIILDSSKCKPDRRVKESPQEEVKYVDDTSSDSSPGHEHDMQLSTKRLSRRRLTQRLSADNLLAAASSPTSSVRFSSPDSIRSVPEPNLRRSVSDELDLITCREYGHKANYRANELQVSMDSLARQALLAVQVLHLIPAEKARERNFLSGRIAANSLLGQTELERILPKREVNIFVGTWNMNGVAPPSELNAFMLPEGVEHIPDIIAIGTQESYSERFEWEVKLQETVGPSHILFHSTSLGTLHLAIFIRRDLLWYCSVPEESSFSVRPGTAFRTKGAVAISFLLFGTSFLFITSHLTAHMEKVKERIQDVKRIVRALDLPKVLPVKHKIKSKDVTQKFDCVLWCGDLNFRLEQSREDVIQWVADSKFPLPVNLQADQLTRLMSEGSCLSSFEEAEITFPPTYKYDPGTQVFDTSHKQRVPAYTDRILFKTRGGASLQCVTYSSVPVVSTSDHKPVWAVYKGTIRPGIDTIPLAAGLFNREVYLEGIKRRAAELSRREFDPSIVCSVQ